MGRALRLSGDDTSGGAVNRCAATGDVEADFASSGARGLAGSAMASLPADPFAQRMVPAGRRWPSCRLLGSRTSRSLAYAVGAPIAALPASAWLPECDWLTAELSSHRVQAELPACSALGCRGCRRARRPHYLPDERLTIALPCGAREVGALPRPPAASSSLPQPCRCLDAPAGLEGGPAALLRGRPPPVNRFPDFVAELVRQLKGSLPTMGRVRIAQLLARAGLALWLPLRCGDLLKKPPPKPKRPPPPLNSGDGAHNGKPRRIVSRFPHHTWHVDFSLISVTGLWAPWLPFSSAPALAFLLVGRRGHPPSGTPMGRGSLLPRCRRCGSVPARAG